MTDARSDPRWFWGGFLLCLLLECPLLVYMTQHPPQVLWAARPAPPDPVMDIQFINLRQRCEDLEARIVELERQAHPPMNHYNTTWIEPKGR